MAKIRGRLAWWGSPRGAMALLVLIILLAFILRLHRLGYQSIWYDEGVSIHLAMKDLRDRTFELNLAAARLAQEVAGDGVIVAGDIGPSGQFMEPLGTMSYEEAVEGFGEQATALVEGGVDILLVETMSDLGEARAAVEAGIEVRLVNATKPGVILKALRGEPVAGTVITR